MKLVVRNPIPLLLEDLRKLRHTFSGFRPALAGQGRPLVFSTLLSLGVIGLELLRPWPLKFLFDRILIRKHGSLHPVLEGSTLLLVLGATCAAVFLIALGVGNLTVWRTVAVARIGRKVSVRIRKRVYEHIHRLDLPFHVSSRTGDLLQRLMGDVNMVKDLLFTSWVSLCERGTLFLGYTTILFLLAPGLALLALLPIPFLFLGLTRSSRELKSVTTKQRRKEGGLASMAAETLRQIRIVKAYTGVERATHQFTRRSRSSERAGMKAAKIAAGMGRTAEIMTGAGLAAVLFFGTRLVLAGGAFSPGDLLLVLSYTRSLYKPIRKLSRESVRLSKATACAERLLEVLRVPAERSDEGTPAPRFRGEIRLEDVSKRYDSGTEALRGLTVTVPPGALAVVSGPNGAGKSTLVSLLLRLIEPDTGRITIDGTPVRDFQLESYRNRIAYVPQEVLLFAGTITDNILYGKPDATVEHVRAAARAALADEFIMNMPEGYDTILGESAQTLSGGEGRRLMLARAALREARILLLDEPLAGLDPEARITVARAIQSIAAGRTAVVVSHGDAEELAPGLRIRLRAGRVEEAIPAARSEGVAP